MKDETKRMTETFDKMVNTLEIETKNLSENIENKKD